MAFVKAAKTSFRCSTQVLCRTKSSQEACSDSFGQEKRPFSEPKAVSAKAETDVRPKKATINNPKNLFLNIDIISS
jgi:hypothetical protein